MTCFTSVHLDGSWSTWSQSTTCSKTCGRGTKQHTREFIYPDPSNPGNMCAGSSYKTLQCNIQPCPVAVGGKMSYVY